MRSPRRSVLALVLCVLASCADEAPPLSASQAKEPGSPPAPAEPDADPAHAPEQGSSAAAKDRPPGGADAKAAAAPSAPADPPPAAAPSAARPDDLPPARLHFEDATRAAGIDLLNWCGSERDTKLTILESIGQGAAWLDDDGDGLLDLFIANGSSLGPLPEEAPTNRYYANRGDGTFEDRTRELGLDSDAWSNGVAAADFDNDGDTDLFVTNWGPHALYRKDANGKFRDVAAEAGLVCDVGEGRPWGAGAAWGDIDLDGSVDLFVTHYLLFDPEHPPNGGKLQNWKGVRDAYYGPIGCEAQPDFLFRNRGDGTFEDVSVASGTRTVTPAYSLGVVFTDVNLDGNPDIYVANDSLPNCMFVGDGKGNFKERAELLGLAYGEQGNPQAGMGVDAADWDADGDDDILVTNFDDDVNTLYRNDGRFFRDVSAVSGLARISRNVLCWGCGFFDFDHDADLDMFIATGHVYPRAETDDPQSSYRQKNQLLVNVGRRFEDATEAAGPAFQIREVSRGTAFGDYDGDGDVDVLAVNLNAQPTLYRNDTETEGAWFQIRLIGARDAASGPDSNGSGSNRDGIGARVHVTFHSGTADSATGARTFSAERRAGASFLSTNSPWLHFGLGSAREVVEVRVDWPSGARSTHGPFPARSRQTLHEPLE